MRLRYGPYAGLDATQVVLREPQYCLWWLAERPQSVLAETFRSLINAVDARAFSHPCTVCGQRGRQAAATAGFVELAPYCWECAPCEDGAVRTPVVRSYEDAIRHIAETCPRAHRVMMRRILKELLRLKGGPHRLTEAATLAWFAEGSRRSNHEGEGRSPNSAGARPRGQPSAAGPKAQASAQLNGGVEPLGVASREDESRRILR